ncbi:AAA family ATPase [Streptomyces sp. NPDC020965]|uniref:AAA family ATPase n=1 Tax=Streptomyces sp. NPDC020965 TaxID=3365105 RepID=UPI00378E198B
MFVNRVYVPEGLVPDRAERGQWPFTVPAVTQLLDEDLVFARPVTFLVGDNGSGKSTLVEAIAESFKLDAYGGRLARVHGRPDPTKTSLGEVLRADTTRAGARMLSGPRKSKKGFFLRAETAFDMTEKLGGVPGYWEEDTSAMSHGEGFLTMFRAMFAVPGFYVMDEPEAALSFTSCLQLVGLMHQLGESGAQVVCATHSPILASTPGADIIETGPDGFHRTKWEDLELVDHWRRYMSAPTAYLRHIVP